MEKWIKWEPAKNLSGKYEIIKIVHTPNIFYITLFDIDNNKKIKIVFRHSIDTYRITYETFRCNTISYLHEQYGPDFYSRWTFFKITNSKYLKWLSEESCTISDSMPFTHFCILTSETLVDIVTGYEPKVEFFTEPELKKS